MSGMTKQDFVPCRRECVFLSQAADARAAEEADEKPSDLEGG
jgi:hypothetical protein